MKIYVQQSPHSPIWVERGGGAGRDSVRPGNFEGCMHWPECGCDGVCFISHKPRRFPFIRVALGGVAFAMLALAALYVAEWLL